MKKITLLALAVMFGLLGLNAAQAAIVNTNAMAVQFAITAVVQTTNSGTFVTNSSGVATTTYAVTTVKITSQDILNLLQEEFGTGFPTGSQLGYNLGSSQGFVVLDKTGALVLNVSTNSDPDYVFSLTNTIVVASQYMTAATGKVTVIASNGNTTESLTEIAPDYGIYYADKNGNNFHFSGLLTLKANAVMTNSVSVYKTVSIAIPGTGGGTFLTQPMANMTPGFSRKPRLLAAGTT